MPKAKTLGQRIAQARRELGVREHRDVTQLDLATAIGVTAATLSRWEADLSAPRDGAFVKLATVLGVDPGYLRYGVTEPRVEIVPKPEPQQPGANAYFAAQDKKKAARRGGQQRKGKAS